MQSSFAVSLTTLLLFAPNILQGQKLNFPTSGRDEIKRDILDDVSPGREACLCGTNAHCIGGDPGKCACDAGFTRDLENLCSAVNFPEVRISVSEEAFQNDIRKAVARTDFAVEEFANTMNDFSQDMMLEMWENEGENFVFSPFSLHTALTLLASASTANTTTESELLDALGRVRNIQSLEMRYFNILQDYRNKSISNILAFGNLLATRPNYYDKINGQFILKILDTFRVDIKLLANSHPENDINEYVAKLTKNKIDRVIDNVNDDVIFLIINAMYFKASWTLVFDELEQPQRFLLSNGGVTMTRMMQRISFDYVVGHFEVKAFQGIRFTTIAIPYQFQNSRFEMVIIMPENVRGLDFLQNSLRTSKDDPKTENIFDKAYEVLEQHRNDRVEHDVTLPKFVVDSKLSIGPLLKKLGVKAAFNQGEFGQLVSRENFRLGEIKHRAIVEVTKDGTVGAAATTIEIIALSGVPSEPQPIVVDKPFIFAVHDRIQRVLLFVGKFSNPNV